MLTRAIFIIAVGGFVSAHVIAVYMMNNTRHAAGGSRIVVVKAAIGD